MLLSLLPTCYCLMIVMKRNSSQARGSSAPPRKLWQRAHCPQSAPASPHRGHCTHIKLKNGVIAKLQTSWAFVSSSADDTAVKHRRVQAATGQYRTQNWGGCQVKYVIMLFGAEKLWAAASSGAMSSQSRLHIPHLNTSTSNWDTLTPSHFTRGTTQLCVYSPMVWHYYNCRTAALMPGCYCIVFGLIVVLQSRDPRGNLTSIIGTDLSAVGSIAR